LNLISYFNTSHKHYHHHHNKQQHKQISAFCYQYY
jgi:hypothetical protein